MNGAVGGDCERRAIERKLVAADGDGRAEARDAANRCGGGARQRGGGAVLLTLMAMFVPEGPPEAVVTNSNVLRALPNLTVSTWPAKSAPLALAAMANVAAPSSWKSTLAPVVEFTIWKASGPFTAGTYELLLAHVGRRRPARCRRGSPSWS